MGSKGKNVSVASFFDLKAEIAKHEDEFAKDKAGPSRGYVTGGVTRPDKKPTIWALQNKGVAARAQRDAEMSVAKPVLEEARETLKRKSKLYNQLRKGKSGGLDEKQYGTLLVDFDTKADEHGFSSDSDDEDESRTVPRAPKDEDPLVEYEDEFGRTRMMRRSELPREYAHEQHLNEDIPADDDPHLLHGGDHQYFPTFKPSEEKIAAIKESLIEDPLNLHYNASREVRSKGAAFYQFSGDVEERQQQMEDLRRARDDTVQKRDESGAQDSPAEDSEPLQSRSIAKRKREIEERRRAVEAKRRKTGPSTTDNVQHAPSPPPPAAAPPPPPPVDDPFARLESQRLPKTSTHATADDFLAGLEREMQRR